MFSTSYETHASGFCGHLTSYATHERVFRGHVDLETDLETLEGVSWPPWRGFHGHFDLESDHETLEEVRGHPGGVSWSTCLAMKPTTWSLDSSPPSLSQVYSITNTATDADKRSTCKGQPRVCRYISTIHQTITQMLQLTLTQYPGGVVWVSCSISVMVWSMVDVYSYTWLPTNQWCVCVVASTQTSKTGSMISIRGRVGDAVYSTQTWWWLPSWRCGALVL